MKRSPPEEISENIHLEGKAMIDHAVTIYAIVDDILKRQAHHDDERCQMYDAEVITTALIAAIDFGGIVEHARIALLQSGLIPKMLSKGRLSVRLTRLIRLMATMFDQIGMAFKEFNTRGEYILDSLPLPIAELVRQRRSRLIWAHRREFIGKHTGKGIYFFGFRLHLLSTPEMIPVEFVLEPARHDDRRALYGLPLALPAGSEIFTDSNYGKLTLEQELREIESIRLNPTRTKSYRQQDPMAEKDYKNLTRKHIETLFSIFQSMLPRVLHVVTLRGAYRKILCFVLGLQFLRAFL
jgi:hypothetical protein